MTTLVRWGLRVVALELYIATHLWLGTTVREPAPFPGVAGPAVHYPPALWVQIVVAVAIIGCSVGSFAPILNRNRHTGSPWR